MRFTFFLLALALLFTITPSISSAQKGESQVAGDESVVDDIKTFTSALYESSKAGEVKSITVNDIRSQVTFFDGEAKGGQRILVVQDLEEGSLSSEWFFKDSAPVFLYRTLEYGKKPDGATWQNFKGVWAWEARVYFDKGHPVFQKVIGRPVASEDELVAIRAEAKEVSELVK